MLAGIIDTLMISSVSDQAVGAVGTANTYLSVFVISFSIISSGVIAVMTQFIGAGKKGIAYQARQIGLVFNLCIGVALSIFLLFFSKNVLEIVGIASNLKGYATTYMQIVGGGCFVMAIIPIFGSYLRAFGYTKEPLWATFSANVINLVLNAVFLYVFHMGVAGVAISTVVARVIAVISVFVFFFVKKIGKISLRYMNPFPGRLLGKMIKIGLPTAGENLTYNLYQTTLLSFVNAMGNDAVNARAYCNMLISFAMIFSNACAMSTQIITGHLVGAGKEETAYKRVFRTLLTSMPITIMLASINAVFCRYTLQIFTQNENIIALGQMIMIVDIFVEIGRCLNMTFVCSLKAAGAYIFPLIMGLLCNWGLGLTTGWLVGVYMGVGVAGIFAGTATDECIRGLIVMYYWYKKKWFGKSVVDKQKKNVLEEEAGA
jgi:putative MATE family efflux protein